MVISINLPHKEFDFIIKKGDKVDFTTPIAKTKHEDNVSIPIASRMGIASSEIFTTLKKVIGDLVKKGELVAEKKAFLKKQQYYSEYDGVLKEIDHNTGSLVITVKSQEEEAIYSFFKGTIIEIEDHKIHVDLGTGHKVQADQIDRDFGGEITQISNESIPSIDEAQVSKKIVIIPGLVPYQEVKLEALDATGFITRHGNPSKSTLPSATLKNESDWENVQKIKHKYCIVSKDNNIIYFYG